MHKCLGYRLNVKLLCIIEMQYMQLILMHSRGLQQMEAYLFFIQFLLRLLKQESRAIAISQR